MIKQLNIKGGFFTDSTSYERAFRSYDIFQRQDRPLDKSTQKRYTEGLPVEEILKSLES